MCFLAVIVWLLISDNTPSEPLQLEHIHPYTEK